MRSLSALVLFAVCAAGSAQEPPLAGRPIMYSRLIGRFAIEATAEPTTVRVHEPIVLRVTISGQPIGDPPDQAKLRLFPEDIEESFFVAEGPDPAKTINEKTWAFAWTLRPKSTDVIEIPSLALITYSPTTRRYQTARTDPIMVKVRPAPSRAGETLPSSFRLLDRSPRTITPWSTWTAIWLATAAAIALIVHWLVRINDRPSLGEYLERIDRDPESAPDVVAAFLRDRAKRPSDVPTGAVTVSDLEPALRESGVDEATRQELTEWWRSVERAKYAPGHPPASWKDASRILTRLDRILAFVIIGIVVNIAWANADDGFTAFDRGDFVEAVAPFQRSADEHSDQPGRWLNLGNALALADRWPEAIDAFRTGLALDPEHAALRDNLRYARERITLPPSFVRPELPPRWGRWLRLGFVMAILTAAIAGPLRRRRIAIAAGLCGLVVAGLMLRNSSWQDEAKITLLRATPFRLGNSDRFPPHPDAAALPAGYEVRRLGERGRWTHVECPGGQIGWIESEAVQATKAP